MVRSRSLFVLAGLTAVVALVLLLRGEGGGEAAADASAGQPLFPGLSDRLNDVAALTLTSGAETLTVRREGDGWVVKEKDGYPAKFDVVKRTLVGLGELRTVEAKTSKPELYGRLGVADPASEGATSTLLVLQDGAGAPVASLIVGNPGPGAGTLFARRTGEGGAWLVRGPLALEKQPTAWLDTSLPKIDSARVKDVTVTHADGEHVTVARGAAEDPVWAVQDVAEGMQTRSPTIGRALAAALEMLTFEDVRATTTAPLPAEQQAVAVVHTFDGLQVTATTAVQDGKTWLTLAAEATEDATDAVKQEVASLAKLGPWVFQIPEYRASNLRKQMSDLVQPIPPPPTPEPAAEPVPGEEPEAPVDGAPPDGTAPADEPPPAPPESDPKAGAAAPASDPAAPAEAPSPPSEPPH